MDEGAVAIVNAHPMGAEQADTAQDMVAIGECGEVPAEAHVTLCDDREEAYRVSQAIAAQFGIPLYDGADPFPVFVDASTYVNVDTDGPDPYSQWRNASQVR